MTGRKLISDEALEEVVCYVTVVPFGFDVDSDKVRRRAREIDAESATRSPQELALLVACEAMDQPDSWPWFGGGSVTGDCLERARRWLEEWCQAQTVSVEVAQRFEDLALRRYLQFVGSEKGRLYRLLMERFSPAPQERSDPSGPDSG